MKNLSFSICLFLSLQAFAQTHFEKIFYQEQGNAWAREDLNGNLVISFSPLSNFLDNKITKMDPSASNIIWSRTYPFDITFEMLPTDEILFAGCDYGNATYCGLMDEFGDTLWTNQYTGSTWNNSYVTGLGKDINGNYFFSIKQLYGANVIHSTFLANNSGDPISYNMTGFDAHCFTSSGNIAVFENNQTNSHLRIFTADFQNVLWQKYFSDTVNQVSYYYNINSIIYSDSLLIAVGQIGGKAGILILDDQGNYIDSLLYDTGKFTDIVKLQSGRFALIGTDSVGSFLKFLDSNYNHISTRHYFGLNYLTLHTIVETLDHGVLVSGVTSIGPTPPQNYLPWILKADSLGHASLIGVNDGPVADILNLSYIGNHIFHIYADKPYTVDILDVSGRRADSIKLNSGTTEFDANHLPGGIYFFAIYNEKELIKTMKAVLD